MVAVSRRHENKLIRSGFNLIAGVDEAGIGPLAGPVVAAAVIFKEGFKLKGLDDSKKLTPKKREQLCRKIIESAVTVGIGIVDSTIIDRINILQASLRAMESAVSSLSKKPNHVMIDGIRKVPGIKIPQTCIKHGDSLSHVIAAASVIAKVARDNIMMEYDRIYPRYKFREHKGYGTEVHMKALLKFGPSPIHRHSYEPVQRAVSQKGIISL